MSKQSIDSCGKLMCKYFSKYKTIILATLLLTLMITFSLSSGHFADFNAINGDFQNFNPVRRLLSGQIPYKDFYDYLGFGHLYFGSLATLLFGGTFNASLIAFTFLSIASLGLLIYIIAYSIFNKKSNALLITIFILLLVITQSKLITIFYSLFDEFSYAINSGLSAGNSARFIRGLILPIAIALAMGLFSFFNKYSNLKNVELLNNYRFTAICFGVISGLCFIWSNDYGVSTWVCLNILLFFIIFSRSKQFFKSVFYTLISVFISFIAIYSVIQIITVGNFSNWLSTTFGNGGFQNWYYNTHNKSYYLYNIDLYPLVLLQAGVSCYYIYKIYEYEASIYSLRRFFPLALLNLTGFCAANMYKLLSGGDLHEVALTILFFTFFIEILYKHRKILNSRMKNRIVIFFVIITSTSYIVIEAKNHYTFVTNQQREGVFVEELDGYLTYLGQDLIDTKNFIGDSSVFSLYASAQEVIQNTYQPTGIDYIIHVLSDSMRADYINYFINEDFKYTSTINRSYTDWAYWIERANWFFFRELYSDWTPVFSNKYSTYWERSEVNLNVLSGNFEIEIYQESDDQIKLVINTDESINGAADVLINYEIFKNNNSSPFNFRQILQVYDSSIPIDSSHSYYNSNNLRNKSVEYIPIHIRNGYGEVTLNSKPNSETILELYEASCNRVFINIY